MTRQRDWDPDTDPHRVQYDAVVIEFWRDGRACGQKHASCCSVHIAGHPHGWTARYDMVDNREGTRYPSELEQLLRAFRNVYHAGQNNWAVQMQKVLRGPGYQ